MKSVMRFLAMALLFPSLLVAQRREGEVRGKVLSAGVPVAGAEVEIGDGARGLVTDASGRFVLSGLPIGPATLTIRAIGFRPRVVSLVVTASSPELVVTLAASGVTLGDVVVTAVRGGTELKDVAGAVSLVDGEMLSRQMTRYQGDELLRVPGVRLIQEDGGQRATAIMRGVPSTHQNNSFLALVDGIPFITGNDEVEFESLVPLPVVDRVEVAKGPGSALYGRGAIAGAINYITRTPDARDGMAGGVEVGSYGYLRPWFGGSVALAPGRNELYLHAMHDRSQGWRDGMQRELTSVFLKNRWLLGDQTTLTSYAQYFDRDQGIGGLIPLRTDGTEIAVAGGDRANYGVEGAFARRDGGSGSLILESRSRAGAAFRLATHYRAIGDQTTTPFYNSVDEVSTTMRFNGFEGKGSTRTFFIEPQLSLQLTPQVRLVTGGSLERVRGSQQEFWTGEYGLTEDFDFLFYEQRRNYRTGEFLNQASWVRDQLLDLSYDATIHGLYAQVELPVASRFALTIGTRYDRFAREARYAEVTTVEGVTPAGRTEDANSRVSLKTSLRFRATEDLTAYASFGEGFQPAFGPVWAFRDRDVTLEPEIARNYEVGLKGFVADRRIGFTLSAYQLNRTDLLVALPGQNGQPPRAANAGGHRVRGVELEVQGRIGALEGYLAYAHTDSRWTDRIVLVGFANTPVDLSGNRVAGVPAHQLSVGATRRLGATAALSAWADWIDDYPIDATNGRLDGGQLRVNAALTLPRVVRGVETQVSLQNALNHRNANYTGFITPLSLTPGRPRELLMSARVVR